MASFSERSRLRLEQCDSRLIHILQRAIIHVDFTVLCGHRDQEAQDEAYRLGRSTKQWPGSRHNRFPSAAVDIAPWHGPIVRIDWDDLQAFSRLAGYLEAVADELGFRIRWGGDWDQDGRTADERFIDAGHIEVVE